MHIERSGTIQGLLASLQDPCPVRRSKDRWQKTIMHYKNLLRPNPETPDTTPLQTRSRRTTSLKRGKAVERKTNDATQSSLHRSTLRGEVVITSIKIKAAFESKGKVKEVYSSSTPSRRHPVGPWRAAARSWRMRRAISINARRCSYVNPRQVTRAISRTVAYGCVRSQGAHANSASRNWPIGL